MNLSLLDDFGSLSSALRSAHLKDLVFDLSGCGQVSSEVRMELYQSVQYLRWRRSDVWVNIEGLYPSRGNRWPRLWPLRAPHGMRATQALRGSFSPLASRFGRSSASSDEDELPEAPDMTPPDFSQIDEKRPFPCSHPGCCSFHDAENGYCEEHQWFGFGSRLCHAMNTTRQHLELALLILIQAAAEVESRYLLLLIAFSLAPVACYSIWQSTGITTTAVFLLFACCVLLSIGYTTVRLNRMQELSKKLEVQSESLYAKYLQPNMTTLFGDDVQENPIQRINSLKEHFLEARRCFEKFNRELCLPLRDFLNSQPAFALSHRVQPVLKSLPLAQEAVAKRGDPNQVLDLLYCEVTFADFDSLSHAWQFLRTRVEGDDLSGVEIACMYDSFALAHSDLRCSELVCRVDGYLATIRFFVAPLRELQLQVDAVHRLAQQLGLSDARSEAFHGRPRSRHPLLVTAVFSMRVVALFAAMYLGGQYFVRYSPSSFRSTVQLFNLVFALKQLEHPDELPEEHWFNWLPSLVLSLPYLALILVLVWDLGSFQAKYRKLKPTQLLYEKYFGVRGRFYSMKVAILQLLTVLLQAFGKLQLLGGIVSLSLQQSKLSDVFARCFWTFVGFLCLNSLYPSVLLAYPSRKWARLGGAMMDAILDMAYTITYLVFTLLAIYELGLEQEISGNFGDEEAVKFTAKLDPALAFPSDFLGYFAVYYSVAHVCTVCRALERVEHSTMPPSLQGSTSSLLRRANRLRLKKCKVVCKALHPICQLAMFLVFCSVLVSISLEPFGLFCVLFFVVVGEIAM